jgi:hypothetical protein
LPKFFQLHQLPKPSGYQEEVPLIAEEAARIVEDDAIAQADRIAEADRLVEDGRMVVEGEPAGNPPMIPGKLKENAFSLLSLRAENAAWKRIVSYMMLRRQSGAPRRSSENEGRRPRRKRHH